VPTSKILWGSPLANELVFSWPLLSVVTDRSPREDSEWIRGISGVEDAWITGRDYELSCEASWIPDGGLSPTPVSGAAGVQAFLDYGRNKGTFRFIPDQSQPGLYIDNCYLAEPIRGFGGLTADIKRTVPLVLRNPTIDFHLALRGLLFEYAAGGSLVDPVTSAFTRAGTPAYHSVDGFVKQVAANAPRDAHWYKDAHATLVESARTNSCLQSETLDNATWAKSRCTISANGLLSPDGVNVTADRIVEDATAGNTHAITQAITITSGEVIAISCYLRLAERTKGRLQFGDAAGSNGFRVDIDLVAGTSVNAGVFGAAAFGGTAIEALANGWYRVVAWGQVNGGVTAAQIAYFLADAGGSIVYNGNSTSGTWAWGFQVERCGTVLGSASSSYIMTTSGTVARSAESVWTWPFPFKPQSMTVYARIKDFYPATNPGTSAVVAMLGDSGFGAVAHSYLLKFNNVWTAGLANESGAAVESSTGALTAAFADDVELVAQIDASNPAAATIKLHVATNGGAFAAQATSSSTRLPYNWNVQLLSLGQTNIGMFGLEQLKYAVGLRTPAEMQAL
jgi:hypothetical protein